MVGTERANTEFSNRTYTVTRYLPQMSAEKVTPNDEEDKQENRENEKSSYVSIADYKIMNYRNDGK